MGNADRLTIEGGTPGAVLMDNAGAGRADVAHAARPSARTVILCGPGNNSGDGFVAARLLAARGHSISLYLLGERARLKGDAAGAAKAYEAAGHAMQDLASADFAPGDL